MEQKPDNQERLFQYLLGKLSEEEMLSLEDSYFFDNGSFDELQAAERELIDLYLEGGLSKDQVYQFEHFFLSTPERQEKLSFARALKRYTPKQKGHKIFLSIYKPVYLPIGLAASVIILLLIGNGIWKGIIDEPTQSRIVAAISNARGGHRSFESRISSFDYEPLQQVRGNDSPIIEKNELGRAKLMARDEVKQHPGAISHHLLGQVYLAEHNFGDAIEQFQIALSLDPNNPEINNDLGVALFERARRNDGSEHRSPELVQARVYFDRAIELNSSAYYAYFNRALWFEFMSDLENARKDWQSYIKNDPRSRWANEAQERLKRLP
jgi:tetratricopeptide (TPR) repeat protein